MASLIVLRGPSLSEEVTSWLQSRGYEIITEVGDKQEERKLRPVEVGDEVFRPHAKIAGSRLGDKLLEQSLVHVRTRSYPTKELAIRRFGSVVHVVFTTDNKYFYYFVMLYIDFVHELSVVSGSTALTKVEGMLHRIHDAIVETIEYIPPNEGLGYEELAEKIGWRWRE